VPTHQYAFFREDKPATPGHSPELICIQNKDHPDKYADGTFKGCQTLDQAIKYALNHHPNENFLGTRQKDKEGMPYEWKTYK